MAVSNYGLRLNQNSLPPKIKGTSVFLQEVHCMGVSGEVLDGIERARLTTIVSSVEWSPFGLSTVAASFRRFWRTDRL